MRLVCLALACVLAAAVPSAGRDALSDADIPRLRPDSTTARRLIADGLERSSTFRRLAARLQRSDVIVYVRLRPDMPPEQGGSLRFLARTVSARFLLVSLNLRHPWPTLVALLGHELQHATEVADAPDVTTERDLRGLYQRIGIRMGVDAYDSRAAQEAGQMVRAELRGPTAEVRVARRGDHAPIDPLENEASIGGTR